MILRSGPGRPGRRAVRDVEAGVSSSTISHDEGNREPRPRVFVSSVIEGFADYRTAARKGIEAAGGTPVMVNEDLPSQITSSRNACLTAIESSDYVLSIVGKRGGWTTPSGRLVVEEEFEHARVHNRPVLAFVQDTPRDADAEHFVRRLSDYVDGMFRTKFQTPTDLEEQVERAVQERLANVSPRNVEGRDLSSYFEAERHSSGAATMLRLVLEPERQEEVIDPVKIASPRSMPSAYGTAKNQDAARHQSDRSRAAPARRGQGTGRGARQARASLDLGVAARAAEKGPLTPAHASATRTCRLRSRRE